MTNVVGGNLICQGQHASAQVNPETAVSRTSSAARGAAGRPLSLRD
jgi:hypothetical protein